MWLIFALLDALMAAISVTLTKAGLKNVNPVLAFALESVLIITISWSAVFFQGGQSEITKIDKQGWTFLACAGVATCLASLFQFRALKDGHAGAVSSIDRSSLVLTILFATLFLKEKTHLATGSWRYIDCRRRGVDSYRQASRKISRAGDLERWFMISK